MDLDKVVSITNEHFKKFGRDDKFVKMEDLILKRNNPYEIYIFARDVLGADIEKCQEAIWDINNFKYIYMFGLDIEKSSYSINVGDWGQFELKIKQPIKAEHQKRLKRLCNNNKFVEYENGLFVVKQGKQGNRKVKFYIDDGTFDMLQKRINENKPISPWFLHYAVEANNYKLVKQILDYGKLEFYWNKDEESRKFDVRSAYYTSGGWGTIAMAFPYTTLAYEASGVSDVRILKAFAEKGCSPKFGLGKSPIYNAILYGGLKNVKYMVEELGLTICEDEQTFANEHFFTTFSDVESAYFNRKKDIFEYFLSFGVDIDRKFEWDDGLIEDFKLEEKAKELKEIERQQELENLEKELEEIRDLYRKGKLLCSLQFHEDSFEARKKRIMGKDPTIYGSIRMLIEFTNDTEYLELINSETYIAARAKRLAKEQEIEKENELKVHCADLEYKMVEMGFKRFSNDEIKFYIENMYDEMCSGWNDILSQYLKAHQSRRKSLLLKMIYKKQKERICNIINGALMTKSRELYIPNVEYLRYKLAENVNEVFELIKKTESEKVIEIYESLFIKNENKYAKKDPNVEVATTDDCKVPF